MYDAISQVQALILANEVKCKDFKDQFSRFDYLWKRDLPATLADFLATEGVVNPDGTRDEPALDKFEAEIAKYRVLQDEIHVRTACLELTAYFVSMDLLSGHSLFPGY